MNLSIVTGAPLCRNPRVVKEAAALEAAGHRVTVFRPVLTEHFLHLDRQIASGTGWDVVTTVDLASGDLSARAARVVRRAGREVVRLGVERPEALGYGLRRTLHAARSVESDLVIGHQEVGLWVANRMAADGRRVGVDIEDWYSEDLSPAARRFLPTRLLQREEAVAVQRGGHVTTTSQALSGALASAYGGPPPTVVYNAFPWADRVQVDGHTRDRAQGDPRRLSLHWVSQTVGLGRGLESVVDALSLVETPVELHLRGACSPEVRAALAGRLVSDRGHSILFHDLVPPSELLSRIAEHDVGLALEAHEPPSRDLTVTNKILHYLLGGLPVIASDTAGQREIQRVAPEAVATFSSGDVAALAAHIRGFASDPARRASASSAALRAAQEQLSWERQAEALVQSVNDALSS